MIQILSREGGHCSTKAKIRNHIIAEYNPRMGDVIILIITFWHEGEKHYR